jgi:peptidoglycan/xylan/chitin deacetylase (PgdA/CDA1 family)
MTRRTMRSHVRLGRAVTALALGLGLLLSMLPAATAATLRDVRLEAGPQTGYRFSSSGAIVARKSVTLSGKALSQTDRRRVVPNRTGIWIRLTSGTLAGYEVRESPVAYVPGKAGDTAYRPAATISIPAGRYLGYRWDSAWDLDSTIYARVGTATTTIATHRAVIDGRSYVLVAAGTWKGTWLPVTEARGRTAQKITCEVPAKPSITSPSIVRAVATTERKLSLTFDLGGRLDPALDIVERLVVDRVCATLFPTGDALATSQGRAAIALAAAHPELFEFGNHTKDHCNLRDGGPVGCPSTPPSASFIAAQLAAAETSIVDVTGRSSKPYWRPPYGASDSRVRAAATDAGYPVTVMWSIDTIDWKLVRDGGPTTAQIAGKVVTNARPGSVVLMHLGGWHTYDALPSMVLRLRAAGLQPTTVTDLLR